MLSKNSRVTPPTQNVNQTMATSCRRHHLSRPTDPDANNIERHNDQPRPSAEHSNSSSNQSNFSLRFFDQSDTSFEMHRQSWQASTDGSAQSTQRSTESLDGASVHACNSQDDAAVAGCSQEDRTGTAESQVADSRIELSGRIDRQRTCAMGLDYIPTASEEPLVAVVSSNLECCRSVHGSPYEAMLQHGGQPKFARHEFVPCSIVNTVTVTAPSLSACMEPAMLRGPGLQQRGLVAQHSLAPRMRLPSVRPNAMSNRQKQLDTLRVYEERFRRTTAAATAPAASADSSIGNMRQADNIVRLQQQDGNIGHHGIFRPLNDGNASAAAPVGGGGRGGLLRGERVIVSVVREKGAPLGECDTPTSNVRTYPGRERSC